MSTDFDPYPLLLLGMGMATIFVLIIYLRVHAFLALIAAALLVGLLSPRVIWQTPELDAYQKFHGAVGGRLAERNVEKLRQEYRDKAKSIPADDGNTELTRPRLQLTNAPELVAQAFGRLMAGIGLSIAFATIIGAALMESGAADRIVRSVVRLFGERYAGVAMLVSGYVLAVPVFFDTVFLLLVPLAKALHLRTGKDYLLYVMAIGTGGAITHSLVPPTPGPITMAELLNVDLGVTILVGLAVGAPLALVGLAYSAFINRIAPVPLRTVGETSLDELERRAVRSDDELPSLFVSLLPIILPVLLITAATVFSTLAGTYPEINAPKLINGIAVSPGGVLNFFGDKNIALLIAAVVSMVLVASQKRLSRHELGRFTARALDDAGMILLITCAGGAFGAMLTAVGVGDSLGVLARQWGIAPLVLGWALAALFKVAQGSGTVAMITSASILAGIVTSQVGPGQTMADYLGYHPVYLVMAIGCGSKVGSWMNDSGFWVVCKMSGMTEVETLRSWTVTLVVMGLAGLPLVWVLTQVLPLV